MYRKQAYPAISFCLLFNNLYSRISKTTATTRMINIIQRKRKPHAQDITAH